MEKESERAGERLDESKEELENADREYKKRLADKEEAEAKEARKQAEEADK